jgi:hypothetical protein
MNSTILKWNITEEQEAHHETAKVSINRLITKAQAEKEAKANGLWDYRNNKIVES